MKTINSPRLIIAGTASGSGKTTVTLSILSALKLSNKKVTAFKCGPDYIDPMFHSKVMGIKSRNLDMFLCGHNAVKHLLGENSFGSDIAVIEGAMGIYDGISFENDKFSANHIARVTGTPEVLVVNVKGMGRSIVAAIKGYLDLHENNLKGVILNNCSKGMYKIYKKTIEESLNIKCYGCLPAVANATIGSRHLGLITADEISDIQDKIEALGEHAQETIDIEGLLDLAGEAPELSYDEIIIKQLVNTDEDGLKKPLKIAVAFDKAFNFYYEDNLELLKKLGAGIEFFSPLDDQRLPDGISGIILGGGYPEEHLEKIQRNTAMKEAIRKAGVSGMPIYAECGGYMYLSQSITKEKESAECVGLVAGNIKMTGKLVRFGYKTLIANHDNYMCKEGEKINCHEFHYSESDCYGEDFTSVRPSGAELKTIYAGDNIWAGYPHVHWYGNIKFAENFVKSCHNFASHSGFITRCNQNKSEARK